MTKVNHTWLANLRYIEENGADFFATGGSQALVGLDLNYIPGRGVNLSGVNQTLRQGYLAAKHIFEHVAPNTIKFVLIDLSPMLFPCAEESEEFDARNIQATSTEDVDLNYERAKKTFLQKSPEQMLLDSGGKIVTDDILDKQLQILQDYAKLCFDNGARPVFVTFPVKQTLRKTYDADILARFRQAVKASGKNFKSLFVDFLDVKLPADYFYCKSHLNSIGAKPITALLGARIYLKNIISVDKIGEMDDNYFKMMSDYFPNDYRTLINHIFCRLAINDFKRLSKILPKNECKDLMARIFSELTYDHLANLSNMLSKDDYNDLATRIFKISAQIIARKDKIKVGFYFDHSSKWPGDELYNLFVQNPRFEPSIFLPIDNNNNEMVRQEFLKDSDKFKARGFKVVHIKNSMLDLPAQDILFRLRPYKDGIPAAFRLINLTVKKTLLVYIPYSFTVADRSQFLDLPFHRVLWKMFFPSPIFLELQNKICKVGMPRGLYSGYPKMDIFFKKDAKFQFNWKMPRPDAKKIIWAPHWSIVRGIHFATFQWNYQFMYEFAKAHPEISWVVKPHSYLPVSAVLTKVFPSTAACEEYFQKWDELSNAQFYNGAYYQSIFSTSDGMIQDCASFVAEYQYVDKPMIFLTREGGKFNKLGEEILKVSYLVDGKDLDAIAAMIQRVFIDGDDYKAAERKEVFNKYLNYPKANGMLASEFIYKSIADELKEV